MVLRMSFLPLSEGERATTRIAPTIALPLCPPYRSTGQEVDIASRMPPFVPSGRSPREREPVGLENWG